MPTKAELELWLSQKVEQLINQANEMDKLEQKVSGLREALEDAVELTKTIMLVYGAEDKGAKAKVENSGGMLSFLVEHKRKFILALNGIMGDYGDTDSVPD